MFTDIDCVTRRADLLDRIGRGGCAVIAGGTDFVPMYAAGVISAGHALDITGVPELTRIDVRDDGIDVGAAVRLVDVARLTAGFAGAVADGAGLVGSTQTRARATLGGNICRASPSGDTLPGILTTQAQMVVASAAGERRVPAEEFFVAPGRTACRSDEILDRVEIPKSTAVSAYVRSTVRNAMDLATIGIAVSVTLSDDVVDQMRIAVGGAGPRPLLISGVDDVVDAFPLAEAEEQLTALEALIQDQISPIDDTRGSAWYRRRLVAPVLRSAIARASQRAALPREACQ